MSRGPKPRDLCRARALPTATDGSRPVDLDFSLKRAAGAAGSKSSSKSTSLEGVGYRPAWSSSVTVVADRSRDRFSREPLDPPALAALDGSRDMRRADPEEARAALVGLDDGPATGVLDMEPEPCRAS